MHDSRFDGPKGADEGGKGQFERKFRVKEFFPDLDEDIVDKLRAFQTELIQFNGRINLISPRTEENCDIIHLADSILAGRLILKNSSQKEIYDIGSGNGLPGIVMAILDETRQFVLVEKDARKVEFMRHVAARIGIKNVNYIQKRIEEFPPDTVHCAVSRGFASISKSILLLRKACAPGAEYYHLKSDSWVREVAQIPTQICSFWEPSLLGNYKLPVSNVEFSVVLTKRLG